MLKVLFVDDEPNVLMGLRRATRSMRHEWDMQFVDSAESALDHFAANDVDVLVTDMRMPGMDGAELLQRIKVQSPGTARIILSGHSEEEAIFRSLSSAHQFLAKPCDLELLKETVNQVRSAQASLGSDELKTLIGNIHELPSLPAVYDELMTAAADPNCNNRTLAAVVSKDVGLTAELLHIVNSAFFGLTRPVESVEHVVSLLGLDVIRAIVASHALFDDESAGSLDLRRLGDHSQETAAMARLVTIEVGGGAAAGAEAFLAGMVHDVGLLVYAQLPDLDGATLRGLAATEDLGAERLATGVDRYAVGAYLLGLWGFTEATTEAVSHLAGPADGPPDGLSWWLRLAHEIVSSGRLRMADVADLGETVGDVIRSLGEELRAEGALVTLAEVPA